MFAVFEDGSRQYRVREGDIVKLDYRSAEVGSTVEFTRVLVCQKNEDTQIGQPTVDGARIVAEVVEHPSTKLYVQHFRRRKNYRRLRGHRQKFTSVLIQQIEWPGMPTAPDVDEEEPTTPEEETAAEDEDEYEDEDEDEDEYEDEDDEEGEDEDENDEDEDEKDEVDEEKAKDQ